jgi:hypothetical protein
MGERDERVAVLGCNAYTMHERFYGGAGDQRERGQSLARRFRRHAEWLESAHRSPLYARLMRAAADDADAGGPVARLFDGVEVPPGAVPQLRLLAAIHELVLAGEAPALAEFYPSVGGERPPDQAWPVARATIDERFGLLRERVGRAVQTNEPGRAAVMFAALLWLTDGYRLPIRLLEIGSSAGLNLLVDRYCYVVDGHELGEPSSPLRFVEPWTPGPPVDVPATARRMRIVERVGCDLEPLDPSRDEDRVRLLSYIWPDELHRIERARTALGIAAGAPAPVVRAEASAWLSEMLERDVDGALTVVWHSVVRQYVAEEDWAAVQAVLAGARAPIAVLSMEPSLAEIGRFELRARTGPGAEEQRLAWCGDHGPPVLWEAAPLPQLLTRDTKVPPE